MNRGTRKKKIKLRNIVLWSITYFMMAIVLAQMVIYAFGKPSWVQAVLFTIGSAWCWMFSYANTRGE